MDGIQDRRWYFGRARRDTLRGCLLSFLASVMLVLFASPAFANSTGALYRAAGDDNGTKATLRGSADLNHDNSSFALSSVRVQKSITGGEGLFQMGWLKLGPNTNFDGDIFGDYTGGFVEWEDASSNGIYNAIALTGIGNYGDSYRFTIKHLTSGWQAIKENGTDIFNIPKSIGFAEGYAMAPSEKVGNIGSMTMTWGPSGTTDWQKFDVGSGNWSTINITGNPPINTDGNWSIGSAPSPFTISR
jgi:hypothetical protein